MTARLEWTHLVAAIFLLVTSACESAPPSTAGAFLDWVRDSAISLDDPGKPLAQPARDAFRAAVADARVVGIGESRHDTSEQFLLRESLTRHLIEHAGFRVLLIEESVPHVQALDRFVTYGDGDAAASLRALAGWYLWDTDPMLGFVHWLRNFNNGRSPSDRVRVAGIDITAPAPAVREVLAALQEIESIAGLSEADFGLDLHTGDQWPTTWQRYQELPEANRSELSAAYARLAEAVDTAGPRIAANGGDIDRLQALAGIAQQGHAFFSTSSREEAGAIRERGMADALLWALDRSGSATRAILWAHNLHVAKAPFRMPGLAEGQLEPMGVLISEALGDDYVAIGAAFGEGRYPADLPPGERNFEQSGTEVLDGALTRTGPDHFLIDLRSAESGSPAATWLTREREWVAQEMVATTVPRDALDMIYFVRTISRARPTSGALERFRSLDR